MELALENIGQAGKGSGAAFGELGSVLEEMGRYPEAVIYCGIAL